MKKILIITIVVLLYACRTSMPAGYSAKPETDETIIAKADGYLSSIPEVFDSIIPAIDRFLLKYENDTEKMRILTRHFYDTFLMSEILGSANIVVHIADNYYINEKVVDGDNRFLREVVDFAKKFRETLIGRKAQNLKMESITGIPEALYDIDSPYTLVYFFDPICSHCKKVTPKIYRAFKNYKNKGLAGFCVYTQNDREEWTDYVAKNNLTEWINVWDPNNENNFRTAYSIYSTPQTYLLDRDKNIIGRSLDDASLTKLLKNLLKE